MDVSLLEKHFARIGARVRFEEVGGRVRRPIAGQIAIDIGTDRLGEYFSFRVAPRARPEIQVLNTEPKLRHLVLMTREHVDNPGNDKFLCGHDERHWFVAAVPGRSASTVRTAMEALKPPDVRVSQARLRLSQAQSQTRHNAAFHRQGEWFFLPVTAMRVDPRLVLHGEALSRGRGKSHWLEFAYRTGGELVYVSPRHPRGLTEVEYAKLMARRPEAAKQPWRTMRRNPGLFAKGRIRHPDHATIVLHDWHRVLMNRENESPSMRHVAFLD